MRSRVIASDRATVNERRYGGSQGLEGGTFPRSLKSLDNRTVVVIGIPALMILLSMTLPVRVNRTTNLVVASLYIPVTVFNAASTSWEWASFYALHRNRGADPGLRPALRLELAPNRTVGDHADQQ